MSGLRNVSHPLPVSWDGRALAWSGWEVAVSSTLRLHVKGGLCACGSVAAPFVARGRREPEVRAAGGGSWLSAPPVWELFAERCPGCGVVTVWDVVADEVWELEECDYGPGGSVAPASASGGGVEPWLVRRDGQVVMRGSGELVGSVAHEGPGRWGHSRDRESLFWPTRRAAVLALVAAAERDARVVVEGDRFCLHCAALLRRDGEGWVHAGTGWIHCPGGETEGLLAWPRAE